MHRTNLRCKYVVKKYFRDSYSRNSIYHKSLLTCMSGSTQKREENKRAFLTLVM